MLQPRRGHCQSEPSSSQSRATAPQCACQARIVGSPGGAGRRARSCQHAEQRRHHRRQVLAAGTSRVTSVQAAQEGVRVRAALDRKSRASSSVSSQGAPRQAQAQSSSTAWPSRTSTLSARASQCTSAVAGRDLPGELLRLEHLGQAVEQRGGHAARVARTRSQASSMLRRLGEARQLRRRPSLRASWPRRGDPRRRPARSTARPVAGHRRPRGRGRPSRRRRTTRAAAAWAPRRQQPTARGSRPG